jgi:hypothetical protein
MGYKFNINPSEPSDDKIARHKDFGKVLHNYQRMTNPLYRTPLYIYRKIFLAVIFVLALAWMVVEFGEHESAKNKIPVDSAHIKDSINKAAKLRSSSTG